MKCGITAALVFTAIAPEALGTTPRVHGQLQAAPPGRVQPVEESGRPAHTGFQMAVRTGVAFPAGKATGASGDSLARRYSWQWPLQIDIGGKATDHLHVGGYFTLSFGAEGNDTEIEDYCDDDDADLENDVSCNAVGVRLGAQVQYHFRPNQLTNPWVGYGIGFESMGQYLDDRERGYSERTTASGITFAKLDGGIDFRLGVGLGFYTELAFGRFTSSSTYINDSQTFSGKTKDRAVHVWTTLGFRLVIFP